MHMEIDLVDDDAVILVTGEEHRHQGNKFYSQGNYKAALECYTAAIDTEPTVATFYNNRSAVYLMLCRYLEAYNDSTKSCELDSTNVKALIRLGKCQLLLGKWDESQLVFEKVLTIDSSNTETKSYLENLTLCRSSFDQYCAQKEKQDPRHALFCIERCLETSPGSDQLKLSKMELLIFLKRYTEAKTSLETLIEKSIDSHVKTEALYFRGLCLYYLEHFDKALSHFQHVLKQSPDHIGAQQAYRRSKKLNQLKEEGNALVKTCKYEKACEVYTIALEIDPTHTVCNAKLFFNRSLTFMKADKHEEALADCDKAIELDPYYIKARARRVNCLKELNRFEEAVKDAEQLNKSHFSDEHAKLLSDAKKALKRSKQFNPYTVLGVSKSATDSDIKKAYRKRALLHHPDRHCHADESVRRVEEQKFKEVNNAYTVLSDQHKRKMYDEGVDIDEVLGNCNQFRTNPMDIFQTFFTTGGGVGGGTTFRMNFQ